MKGDTRVLVLSWCLWLLGAWSVSLLMDNATRAVRWMLFSSLIGLMVIWPAVRLCQLKMPGRSESGIPILAEWMCLNLVFQAVVWPLRVSMDWSLAQTLWLDAAFAVWSALTALVIAWGRRHDRPGPRTLAMVACVALLLAEPLVMTLSRARWPLRVSPVETIWALSNPAREFVFEPWITHVGLAALAALAGWLLFAVAVK